MSNKVTKKPLYKPALAGFGLVVLSLLAVMSGPLGSRLGWWNFDSAVNIAKWAVYIGVIACLLCFSGLMAARPGGNRRGFFFSLLGLIIFLPMLFYLHSWNEAKHSLPPIQDITTNSENPPTFWDAPNSRVYGGVGTAAFQEEAYPDIQPLILPISADKTFDLAIDIIRKEGWELWPYYREEKHIEATEKTFWFGFSDDMVIHITEINKDSSRVDMRSTSRFGGGGDGGTNANRIRSFFVALEKRARE